MDDTAFHYSRTLRIIMILAIVVPILGIGFLLWYFSSVDVPEAPLPAEGGAVVTTAPNGADSPGAALSLPENDNSEDS